MMWDMDELKQVVEENGALLVVEGDVTYIIDVATGFRVIWRDGELYALNGRPLMEVLNEFCANITELVLSAVGEVQQALDGLMEIPEIKAVIEGLMEQAEGDRQND